MKTITRDGAPLEIQELGMQTWGYLNVVRLETCWASGCRAGKQQLAVFNSLTEVAQMYGVNREVLRRNLEKLESEGFIVIEQRPSSGNQCPWIVREVTRDSQSQALPDPLATENSESCDDQSRNSPTGVASPATESRESTSQSADDERLTDHQEGLRPERDDKNLKVFKSREALREYLIEWMGFSDWEESERAQYLELPMHNPRPYGAVYDPGGDGGAVDVRAAEGGEQDGRGPDGTE